LYWLKLVISCLLVVGLNQNLLFYITNSQQKDEQQSMKISCACQPSSCMCPPTSGCEHQHGRSKQKQDISEPKITACRPNPSSRDAAGPFSMGWKITILTQHLDSMTPYLSFTYIDRFSADITSQQYLTPPDKPPQSSIA
jgi:hypothetical protein